jgi:hypothetical protein
MVLVVVVVVVEEELEVTDAKAATTTATTEIVMQTPDPKRKNLLPERQWRLRRKVTTTMMTAVGMRVAKYRRHLHHRPHGRGRWMSTETLPVTTAETVSVMTETGLFRDASKRLMIEIGYAIVIVIVTALRSLHGTVTTVASTDPPSTEISSDLVEVG